jgi:hypothetical protein
VHQNQVRLLLPVISGHVHLTAAEPRSLCFSAGATRDPRLLEAVLDRRPCARRPLLAFLEAGGLREGKRKEATAAGTPTSPHADVGASVAGRFAVVA